MRNFIKLFNKICLIIIPEHKQLKINSVNQRSNINQSYVTLLNYNIVANDIFLTHISYITQIHKSKQIPPYKGFFSSIRFATQVFIDTRRSNQEKGWSFQMTNCTSISSIRETSSISDDTQSTVYLS